jgi:hypothetical protein
MATTVAAVAPVLMLAGVVEMAAFHGRYKKAKEADLAALERALARIEVEGADDPRRTVREIRAELSTVPGVTRRLRYAGIVWALWGTWGMALVWAMQFALQWLGQPGSGPEEVRASWCVVVLVLCSYWLVLLPVVQHLSFDLPAERRERHLRRQIQAFYAATEAVHGREGDWSR